MKGLCERNLGATGQVTGILQVENWKKVDKFEPIIYFAKYRYQ